MGLGCGVTAYTFGDAVAVLAQAVFTQGRAFEIAGVVEDVDVSTLDANHVIPNIAAPVWRGVWFPKGYYLRVRQRLAECAHDACVLTCHNPVRLKSIVSPPNGE